MPRFGFIGDSYAAQSSSAAAQKTMNWYLQIVESDGKSRAFFMPSPGLKSFCNLGDAKVRGLFAYKGPQIFTTASSSFQQERVFAVGQSFYEINADGTKTNYGAVAYDGNPASLVAGPNQVLICSGGLLYIFNLGSNTLSGPLADPTNVISVAYGDGYYLALIANSNKFRVSALLDCTNWPAAQVNAITYFPDDVIGFVIDHRQAVLLGNKQGVFYSDTASLNIFDPIGSDFMEQGLASPFAISRLDNSFFWLGQDERGAGIAWRTDGSTPRRVSTHAVEAIWQNYSRISDTVAYSFQRDGHTFWHLYFPSVDSFTSASWRYDASSGLWHEVGNWANAHFQAHLSQCHAYGFGKNLVGDWNSGNIYDMSANYADDNGAAIRRVRRAPYISGEDDWIYFYKLVIWLEQGLALQSGLGSAPILFLKWSDDGGHTWSNEYQIPIGLVGQYKARALKYRLGRARSRVFEVSVSDPIPWRLIDAYYNGSDSTQGPQQRLPEQLRKSA